MENLLQTVRELKTKAKNRRDLERYGSAVTFLKTAIQALERALEKASVTDWKSQLALELADCFGLLGGINRRWGLSLSDPKERLQRLQESFDAYHKGYKEYEAREEYKISTSYNMLNRVVSYLFVNPASLSDTPATLPDGETFMVKKELEHIRESISQQLMLERRGDIWALADLALVNLLLDRETPAAAYENFLKASPPDYAYESVLSVLQPLASLPLPPADKMREAIHLLESGVSKTKH